MMQDVDILAQMIKTTAQVPLKDEYGKSAVTLIEPQAPDSSTTIRNMPADAMVIKVDIFNSPDKIFNGNRGECKRCDREKDQAQVEAQDQAQVEVEAQVNFQILSACAQGPLSSAEIATALGHNQLSGNLRKALPRLRLAGLLAFTVPDKPRNRLQKYRLTETGKNG
jgi:hypothetical protein